MLQVPVPALDELVRSRTAYYDEGFVSADPSFVHAHITALGPFVEDPTPADLEVVARIAAATPAFDVVLAEVEAFPNGIIYLRPDPDVGFRELTARLSEAFPEHPPYGGRFGVTADVVPHLTLDLTSTEVTIASTRRLIGAGVPVSFHADRLDLAWYESGCCRLLDSWPLS